MTKLQYNRPDELDHNDFLDDIDIDYQEDTIVADVEDWTNELDDWYPEANEFFRQYRAEQNIFDY